MWNRSYFRKNTKSLICKFVSQVQEFFSSAILVLTFINCSVELKIYPVVLNIRSTKSRRGVPIFSRIDFFQNKTISRWFGPSANVFVDFYTPRHTGSKNIMLGSFQFFVILNSFLNLLVQMDSSRNVDAKNVLISLKGF